MSRAVTRVAIRETRAAELRAEIINSDRLQSHFQQNPADLQLLQPDAASGACIERMKNRFQDGLSHEVYAYSKAVRWLNIAAALLLALSIGGWIAVNSKAPGIEVYAQESNQLDQAIHDFLSRPASND